MFFVFYSYFFVSMMISILLVQNGIFLALMNEFDYNFIRTKEI